MYQHDAGHFTCQTSSAQCVQMPQSEDIVGRQCALGFSLQTRPSMVVQCPADLEWCSSAASSCQPTALHGRLRHGMGWLDCPGLTVTGLRNVGNPGISMSQQLQRVAGCLSQSSEPPAHHVGACSSSGIRQHDDCCIPESSQWSRSNFSDSHQNHFLLGVIKTKSHCLLNISVG